MTMMRITLFLCSITLLTVCHGFAPPQTSLSLRSTAASALRMSDLPEPPTTSSWPPSPEDQLVMTGDVAALFVYSFLDHSLNELYINQVQASIDSGKAIDPVLLMDNGGVSSMQHMPVWFDAVHSIYSPERLELMLGLQDVNYSPILSAAGIASVAITSCWLLSGWMQGAFSFENTVDCTQSRALSVTFKSWMGASVLMVLLCLTSDVAWSSIDSLHAPSLGGITRADADYIFDSLSVLITWRFVVSWLLGSGKKR